MKTNYRSCSHPFSKHGRLFKQKINPNLKHFVFEFFVFPIIQLNVAENLNPAWIYRRHYIS